MPTAATQSPPAKGAKNDRPMPSVPFIRASALHREAAFFDSSFAVTANQRDLGVIEIPAYGYVRNIVLYVQATGGAAGLATVATAEDGPWAALQNIQLLEPNGAQIQQFDSGYELMLANKYGGYISPGLSNDPRGNLLYSAISAAGNFSFILRIPVELDLRSGLGSLPNQAANATFRLRMTQGSSANIYATAPDTLPTALRIRAFLEAWDQPEISSGGLTNQTVPPAMNTTQFWSRQVYNVSTGNQTVRLTRVGNYVRNLIFILRSGAAPSQRSNGQTLYPAQSTLFLDSRPMDVITDDLWRAQQYERGGYGGYYAIATAFNPNETPFGQDNGVRCYDFAHEFDGAYGRENRDLWLPTLNSTRLEIQGVFGTLSSGTLTVLTNDVAIAGNVFI